ncbi:MAG: hypothetical protein AAF268_11095 [Cyanobacteria bacterium P01_A01_bin.3]
MRISKTVVLAALAMTGATALSVAPASAGIVGRLAELRSTSPENGVSRSVVADRHRQLSAVEVASDSPVTAAESSSRSSFIDRINDLSSTSPE